MPEVEPKEGQSPWLMLIQVLPTGLDLDRPAEADERRWQASPQARFERLLRETGVADRAARATAPTCGWSTPRGARPRAT